jgi:hypothetical protein
MNGEGFVEVIEQMASSAQFVALIPPLQTLQDSLHRRPLRAFRSVATPEELKVKYEPAKTRLAR